MVCLRVVWNALWDCSWRSGPCRVVSPCGLQDLQPRCELSFPVRDDPLFSRRRPLFLLRLLCCCFGGFRGCGSAVTVGLRGLVGWLVVSGCLRVVVGLLVHRVAGVAGWGLSRLCLSAAYGLPQSWLGTVVVLLGFVAPIAVVCLSVACRRVVLLRLCCVGGAGSFVVAFLLRGCVAAAAVPVVGARPAVAGSLAALPSGWLASSCSRVGCFVLLLLLLLLLLVSLRLQGGLVWSQVVVVGALPVAAGSLAALPSGLLVTACLVLLLALWLQGGLVLSQASARRVAVLVVLALERPGGLSLLVRFYAWLLAWQLLLLGLLGLLSVWWGELAVALLVVPVLVPPLLRVGGLPLPLRLRRLALVPLVVARLVCLAGCSVGDVACPPVAGPGCGATMPTLPMSSWRMTAGLLSVGGLLWLLPLLLLL